MPAAASAARGVPRQGCLSSPSSHGPSFHNMTTKDTQSFVSSDSSVFTQLHWHGPLVKLIYLCCWHTQAQAGSLLQKSREEPHLLGHMPFTPSHRQTVFMFIPSRLKWSWHQFTKINYPSSVAEWCARSEFPLWDHTAHKNGLNFGFLHCWGKFSSFPFPFCSPNQKFLVPKLWTKRDALTYSFQHEDTLCLTALKNIQQKHI